MTTMLYDATVPVLSRYLLRLDGLLALAEAHVRGGGLSERDVLEARLVEDMFPLAQQVRSACGFAFRTVFPLMRREAPTVSEGQGSLAELRLLTRETWQTLQALSADAFDTGALPVTGEAGFASLTLPPREYALHYAMPNFFFHLSMTYAVLRYLGVPVGKPDFDGYHVYPPGFRFAPADAGSMPDD